MKKRYPEGIRIFKKNDKAPEFVLGAVSIDKAKFMDWLQKEESDSKGYVRLDLLQGKEAPYLTCNDYKKQDEIPTIENF